MKVIVSPHCINCHSNFEEIDQTTAEKRELRPVSVYLNYRRESLILPLGVRLSSLEAVKYILYSLTVREDTDASRWLHAINVHYEIPFNLS